MDTEHRTTKSRSQKKTDAVGRLELTSYDSGYEHSLDHWVELQDLIRKAESGLPPAALAATGLGLDG